MDDRTKITALMVYYEHWGRCEIRARKAVDGIHRTLSVLKNLCHHDHGVSLMYSMTDYFSMYADEPIKVLYKDMICALLQDCGKFYDEDFDDETGYTVEDLLYDRKYTLEYNTGDMGAEAVSILYDDSFTADHTRSVESIVALKPLRCYDDQLYDEFPDL